jgi:putative molybdopterin biosynthesis protein
MTTRKTTSTNPESRERNTAVVVPEMMSTVEVADYLRVSERTIYDLLKEKRIPSTRVTGKWLFPKKLIDRWVAHNTEYSPAKTRDASPIVAGSHDPLLEWALRESRSGLAMMAGGSLDGIRRVVEGEVIAAATHVIDSASGEFNVPFLREHHARSHLVLIHWAKRKQGLIVRDGDEKKFQSLVKLKTPKVRVVMRQPESGAFHLFNHLLREAKLAIESFNTTDAPALTDTDLAQRIRDGDGDVGLGCESAARAAGLQFVPLIEENFDLLMRRRDFFEAPLQSLFGFARTNAFAKRANSMGGYNVDRLGSVGYNP